MRDIHTHLRIAIEKLLVEKVVRTAIEKGWLLSVDSMDDEDYLIENSNDPEAVLKEMFSMDEDRLYLSLPDETKRVWVYFIYGNDGTDVVHDYTTSAEDVVRPALDLADRLEEGHFRIAPS